MRNVNWADLKEEMIRYLKDLIQMDTTPGRGGETRAAHYLKAVLAAHGLQAEVREPVPGKGSLICRQPGEAPDQSLLLLSHLDTAPVKDLSEWHYPPFSGACQAGEIWGRGAVDCKGPAVVWLMLVLLLRRRGIPLKRGLVYAATADEESGSRWGVEWLLKHTRDFHGCRYALNEGGGFSFHHRKGIVYTCQYGEKGSLVFRGRIPPDNREESLDQDFPGRIRKTRIQPQNSQLVRPMLDALGRISGVPGALSPWLPYEGKAALIKKFAGLPLDYADLLYHTLTVESWPARQGDPSVRRIHLSFLPGESLAELEERIFRPGFLFPGQVGMIERTAGMKAGVGAGASSLKTPLYRLIRTAVEGKKPGGGKLLPWVSPGMTDSRLLRAEGITCYGFFPTPPETDIRLIHKANERIPADALVFALQRLYEAAVPFLTADDISLAKKWER